MASIPCIAGGEQGGRPCELNYSVIISWNMPIGEISSELYRALVRDMKKHVIFRLQSSKISFAHA